jgi:hypothetical protein
MNHLRSILGFAAVTTTLVTGTTAGVASASTAAATKSPPSVCYEVQNKLLQWLDTDQGCDNRKVKPSGGVYGLAITVDGVRQVLYSASSDGVVFDSGRDGDLANADNPTTALRAMISPRGNRHLKYTVTYDSGAGLVSEEDKDGEVVGNGADTITSIRMKITP